MKYNNKKTLPCNEHLNLRKGEDKQHFSLTPDYLTSLKIHLKKIQTPQCFHVLTLRLPGET